MVNLAQMRNAGLRYPKIPWDDLLSPYNATKNQIYMGKAGSTRSIFFLIGYLVRVF